MDNVINRDEYRKWNLEHLKQNYRDIFDLKIQIYLLQKHSVYGGNTLIANFSQQYYFNIIRDFKQSMNTKPIDDFLSLVLDPLGRTVSMQELVQNYNFPTENVSGLEIDEYMDDYF